MNQQQRSATIRATFDTVAEGYDNRTLRFFSDSVRNLSECLDLTGSEHVLDVATGTGVAAIELARQLPHGRVTGIDFSGGMLAQARKKAELQGLHNLCFIEMDMQSMDFPDNHFDATVCSFGIFFVEDMGSQLRHISEKTKPGGRIVISTFSEDSFSPLAEIFLSRIRDYGIAAPPLPWKIIGTEAKCAALFQDAGLAGVQAVKRDLGYYLKSSQDWWSVVWWGGFRRFVSQLSASALEAFRTEHLREVQTLSTRDGIKLNVNVLYTMGTKPCASAIRPDRTEWELRRS